MALPRILAIHAHPDDVELQCAGTLFRLKQLGCPITIVTMTPGDLGSAELSSEEIAAVRRQEAQKGLTCWGPITCAWNFAICRSSSTTMAADG